MGPKFPNAKKIQLQSTSRRAASQTRTDESGDAFSIRILRLLKLCGRFLFGVSWGILIDLICKAPTNTSPNYGEPPRLAANRSGRWGLEGGGGGSKEKGAG